MLAFISANLGTILISLLLLVLVFAIIRKIITDKKHGISSCGGNCAHCKMCAACRKGTENNVHTKEVRS